MKKRMESLKLEYDFSSDRIQIRIPNDATAYNFMELADIFGGSSGWFFGGTYACPNAPQFYSQKAICVHLDQINTTQNILQGQKSTLLRIVPTNDTEFGEVITLSFENPQFRRLNNGTIQELSISILDINGKRLDMNNYSCFITLEVKDI